MCVLESLSHALSTHVQGWQRGSGVGPALDPAELAGMLAGLPDGCVWLAYARLALDEQAGRRLYAKLHVIAAGWATHERWGDVPRGSERLGSLARLVRDDLVLARPRLSERESAEKLGISRRQWRQVWQDRHSRLLGVGMEWEGALRRKLARELYGGRFD